MRATYVAIVARLKPHRPANAGRPSPGNGAGEGKQHDDHLSTRTYLSGFANHFSTEAVAGALPVGRNSPQKVPFGLYTEQLSGTAFTAPRHENRRSWLYRLRPERRPRAVRALRGRAALAPDRSTRAADPQPPALGARCRSPTHRPIRRRPRHHGGNADVAARNGLGVHLYAANRSMEGRVFFDADGELLIVRSTARFTLVTELGVMTVAPATSR